MRVCRYAPCLTLTPNLYCPEHAQQHERQRGSRQARGYDSNHDRLRQAWAPKVATGTVKCWRCGNPISKSQAWDLGHDDNDRSMYRGPEHQRCNRSAAGRQSHH